MQNILELFLGILSAMGGFVDIGELVFALNAGAKFGYSLLWIALLGTLGIIVYGEMAGRIAAVTGLSIFDIVRDRVGLAAGLVTLIAANVVNVMTCAAEIGGVAIILKLILGWPYRLFIVLTLLFLLLSVWFLPFKWIERTFGLLGLFMVVFMFTAVSFNPDWSEVAGSFIPNIPQVKSQSDYYLYAYFAVALMSAIMLPYEVYFYNAGGVEDRWTPSDITINRVTSIVGFTLGAVLATSLILIGAQYFKPNQLDETQLPGAAALGPIAAYGQWGLIAALLGMFFAFSGAAIETCLSAAYNFAQFWGWPWGKFRGPKKAARWYLAWILVFTLAAAITLTGIDPVNLVEYSIVFSIVILPLTYLPVLAIARNKTVMGDFANGVTANVLGWFYLIIITLAALAAIPLLLITHGGKG
jgi:Mn2+/Fe2+ NRAMP family transporter